MSVRRVLAVCGVLAVLVVAGCGRGTAVDGDDPPPVRPAWRSVTLPAPPGAPGRPMVRDAAVCAGHWYLVGGVADGSGAIRPAAWSSGDGLVWSALPVSPSSFYGRQQLLYAAACREARLAALGAATGGVHGNPRTSSWIQASGGALREVPAPFERFGGPRAVSAARVVGGPAGWLIVGARADGAAVWTSVDGGGFTLREGLPELAGDGRGRTSAYDGSALGSGWLVVGAVLPAGGTVLAPVAWTSADGVGWRRVELPAPGGRGQAQRVVAVAGSVMAVGPVGDGFAAWRASVAAGAAGSWRRVGGFPAAGSGVASVAGLAGVDRVLVAAVADGEGHALWCSADSGGSWSPVVMPAEVPDRGDAAVSVVAHGGRLLVSADDGRGSRAWWAPVSAVDR
ncbi:hypothetical protein OG994_02585 [Micromonospora globbae]|uniref:Exo-alpha-sialidase n=1 Tax=Micromonospora globbae TaxID=1894969 RepID=A0ABZ1S7V2_9ACTN|nr:hypothetical protein [Micromonospora globbae]